MALTEEQKQLIVEKYQAGTTASKIADEFDIWENDVFLVLRKFNIKKDKLLKISDQNRQKIINDYASGIKMKDLSDSYGVNISTISRIVNKNKSPTSVPAIKFDMPKKYGTSYVPTYKGETTTKEILEGMSESEKDEYCDFIFKYFRKINKFPYPEMSDDEILNDFIKVKNTDYNSVINGDKFNIKNRNGIALIKHFAPHFFHVNGKRNDRPSLYDTFFNDKLLMNIIKNRAKLNYPLSGNMLRQGMANSNVSFKASTFNVIVAKAIYSLYCNDGDIIYDYSMGFGQRLLAALSLPYRVEYIGVDPFDKMVESNKKIYEFLNKVDVDVNRSKKVSIIQSGSESYFDERYEGKVQVAFSSPPYYNIENYDSSNTQAYSGGYVDFIHNWWRATVSNISRMVKEDGYFILNMIEKVDSFPIANDMNRIIMDSGFEQVKTHYLQLNDKNGFRNPKGIEKLEPIFVFRKVKK